MDAVGLGDDVTGNDKSEEGFSLIELLVALLVLGILLAVAIPTFLGTTAAADNRSAQSNLITAFSDAKTQFQNDGQTYFIGGTQNSSAFASVLNKAQLDLSFRDGALGSSASQGSSGSLSSISVAVSTDGNGLILAAYSVPGNCFYVVDNAEPLTASARSVAPYAGITTVTTSATPPATAGSIGLPTIIGTSFVEVKGDTDTSDCNAYTPKAPSAPGTVQYSTSQFPS